MRFKTKPYRNVSIFKLISNVTGILLLLVVLLLISTRTNIEVCVYNQNVMFTRYILIYKRIRIIQITRKHTSL